METTKARAVGFFVPYLAVLITALVWANIDPGITRLGSHRIAFLWLIGIAWGWVAVRAYFHFKDWVPSSWEHWGVAVDIAIITVAVYLTQFATSETFLLYFWPIATFSIARLPRATIAVGLTSVILYVLATWPDRFVEGYATAITFRAIILLITTGLAAFHAKSERERIEEMARLRAAVALSEYRERLSQELHDGIQHFLVNIMMRLELARVRMGEDPVEAARLATDERARVRQAADELRYVVRLLRSPALEREGFIEALRHHLVTYEEASSLAVPLEIEGEVRSLPPELAHAAFRIVQEAILNAEKHAQAKEARVGLIFSTDAFCCTIKDNGVGFDSAAVPNTLTPAHGFGLATMQQRAESVGGELHIISRPGQGTEVQFTAPLSSPPPHLPNA